MVFGGVAEKTYHGFSCLIKRPVMSEIVQLTQALRKPDRTSHFLSIPDNEAHFRRLSRRVQTTLENVPKVG